MSLVLIEGFDDEGYRNSTLNGSVARGRNGTKGSSSFTSYTIPVAAQSDTITMGVAVKMGAGFGTTNLLQLSGPGSTSLTWQMSTARRLTLSIAGGTPSSLATADLFVPGADVWWYLEVQAKIANAPNGFVKAAVNGVEVAALTQSGIDTAASGSSTVFDSVNMNLSGTNAGVDDLYLCTGGGDTFFGDCVVEVLYPNGNGSVNAWVGSDFDATDNWQLVDESPYSSVDWLGTSTVGAQDLYTLPDLSASGTAIYGICHQVIAQRTDATARSLKMLTKGSTVNASAAVALTTGFTSINYPLATNPEGGAAWTVATVNALQVGVESA